MVDRLWYFLEPGLIDQHVDVVNYFWRLEALAPTQMVENAICSYLIQQDSERRLVAYDKFGIFWRVSETMPNASITFSKALMLMMDLLRSQHPVNKMAGETFLKCSLKSLARYFTFIIVVYCFNCLVYDLSNSNLGYWILFC